VGIIHDITELKRVERQLRDLNAELEQRVEERTAELKQAQEDAIRKERLAVLGQLAGGLAHQLRNPLGTVINAVSILSKQDVQDEGREALRIIETESWRANKIVTDLLSYARVRDAELRSESLLEVVEGVLRRVEQPTGVQIDVRVPSQLMAQMDARQISEALGNLVVNAIDAVGESGRILIDAVQRPGATILAVNDDGPGVPHDIMDHLFDPLFTTKEEGFGLGLATARNLVRANGGTLRCTSTGVSGSRFEIAFPS